MTEQYEAKVNPQRWSERDSKAAAPLPTPEPRKKSNTILIIGSALLIAAAMLFSEKLGVKHIGLAAVLFLGGFVQFNWVTNRGGAAMLLWAIVLAGSVYFYALLGLAVFAVGVIFGAMHGTSHLRTGS